MVLYSNYYTKIIAFTDALFYSVYHSLWSFSCRNDKKIYINIYIAYRKDALSLIEEKEWQYANKDIKEWERE